MGIMLTGKHVEIILIERPSKSAKRGLLINVFYLYGVLELVLPNYYLLLSLSLLQWYKHG